MRIEHDLHFDFDDVLIKPKRSQSASRADVDLVRTYKMANSGQTMAIVPIVAANMSTTGTMAMHRALSKYGMMTALHKFHNVDKATEALRTGNPNFLFYTVGIRHEDFDVLTELHARSVSIPNICIDVANGYTQNFVRHVRRIRDIFPRSVIMAGNVATPEMVQELVIAGGADIVKIGIGPGSVCTTRIVTGVGVPQLSAIVECADAAHGLKAHVCSDGGCREPGDIAKAFAAGSDFVMLGGMLAGHDECDGEWVETSEINHSGNVPFVTGKHVKKAMKFYGMSSKFAVDKFNGGMKGYRAAEGKETLVPYRGPVSDTLEYIMGGLRGTCSLVGARSLKELSKCTTFIRVARTHNTVFG